MRRRPSPYLVLSLVVALLSCLAGGRSVLRAGPDEGEWSKRYDRFLPGTQPAKKGDLRGAVLVRDARTGLPIRGARLRMFVEDLHDLTLSAPPRGVVTTDEYGIANSPGDTFDFQSVVDAPGYAPQGQYGGGFDWIVELERGITARGRLLDTLGKPFVDTPVEYYLGCHHSPGVQRVVTDAEGRFGWVHADPMGQVWYPFRMHISGPDVSDFVPLGDTRPTRVLDRGWTATGRVLDASGRPLFGCVVRSRSREDSRGPAVASGADGSFSLAGLDPEAPLYFFHADHDGGGTPFRTINAWHRSVPLTVRFGPRKTPARAVPILMTAVAGMEVLVVRMEDGVGVRARAGAHGGVDLGLVPGRYRLFPARPFDTFEADPVEAELPSSDGRSVKFEIARCPMLRIELEDRKRCERIYSAVLWCDGYAREISLQEPGQVPVPAERPVSLVLSDGMTTRVLGLEAVEKNQRRVRVAWPRATRIQLPLKEARLLWPPDHRFETDRDAAGNLVLLTYATGRVRLQLLPGDQEDPVSVDVVLPDEPGGVVRVEHDALETYRPRTFEVRLPDGSPARGARIDVYALGDREHGAVEEIDETGRCTLSCPPGGPLFYTADLDGYLELRGTLQGKEPHVIRWPRGVLDVKVRGPRQEPLEFPLYLDGRLLECDAPGRLVVKGVEPGMHTVIVGASGHFGRVMRIKVGADAPRLLEVQLELRAAPLPDKPRK